MSEVSGPILNNIYFLHQDIGEQKSVKYITCCLMFLKKHQLESQIKLVNTFTYVFLVFDHLGGPYFQIDIIFMVLLLILMLFYILKWYYM